MRIKSKDVILDKINWTKLQVNQSGQRMEIWLNPNNVQHVIFDNELKIITIAMNNTDVFEIVCDHDFQAYQEILKKHIIYNPIKNFYYKK